MRMARLCRRTARLLMRPARLLLQSARLHGRSAPLLLQMARLHGWCSRCFTLCCFAPSLFDSNFSINKQPIYSEDDEEYF